MCKTFDAIHKMSENLSKEGKGKNIKIILNHLKIKGELICAEGKNYCLKDVLTLKNAKVKCPKNPEHVKEIEWLHIPTHHIIAFTFLSDEQMG